MTTAREAGGVAAVPSLRGRLGRFVLLLAVIWVVVVTVVLAGWLRHEVSELLDDGLVATSEALAVVLQAAQAPTDDAPGGRVHAGPDAVAAAQDDVPFAWQLLDAEGRMLARSANAPAPHLLAQPPAASAAVPSAFFTDGPLGWRVRARPLAGGRWLLVGQRASERFEALVEVAGGTIAAALVASLALLAWLRLRLERETRPLADLGGVLARYDPLHAGDTLPPPALQELAPVHEAVRQMGGRLAAHAAAERAFSAHAAHALRTPLAGLDAQLAVAQREAPPALQPRLARLRAAVRRLAHVVTALLALFRSGGELKRVPVDVEALVARVPFEGLAMEFLPRADEPPVRPAADADLLAAALINLLDNAVRHGARRVCVQVHPAHITLRDDGPGVSDERRGHLQQALASEAAGGMAPEQALAGLGLALADRVARAHGGRLELLPAAAGFSVRLWLVPPAVAGSGGADARAGR
ncbi:MAG: HAMP domain-containing histidine kinase, partial [Rubrivivax sp.]|nr:HAMP domain-containing histidine kinase [Rubrivivax sp.]